MARLAALCSLLGLLAAVAGPFLLLIALGLHVPFLKVSFGTAAFTIAIVEEIIGVIAAGAALTLISMILYIVAFNTLRKLQPGFGGPMGLSIVGLLGMLLITLGAVLVLATLVSAVQCASSGSSCVDFASLGAGVWSILIGALLAFIGWIGLLIGVYRIGKRYDSTLTKVGAIIYIIPLVNIIAPILAFVGIHSIVGKLERQARGG
jgi:hypothetical protein